MNVKQKDRRNKNNYKIQLLYRPKLLVNRIKNLNELEEFQESESIRRLETRKSIQIFGSLAKLIIFERVIIHLWVRHLITGKLKFLFNQKNYQRIKEYYLILYQEKYHYDLQILLKVLIIYYVIQQEKIEKFLSVKRKSHHIYCFQQPNCMMMICKKREDQINILTKANQGKDKDR